jgi:outer membrane receptor for ferrienterochelin and colicins
MGQKAEAQSFLTVTDIQGEPLYKAMLTYSSSGVDGVALFSDEAGLIRIDDSALNSDTLVGTLNYLGMIKSEVLIPRGSRFTIQMKADPLLLKEMVVTGEYAATHAEHSVHRVEVISAEEIQSIGANELGDVLQHAGDIQIRQDAVIGSGISLQGLDDRNVKICINEVPIIGRVDGKLDLGQIDIDDIERIEIVRGPMAVSYGTDAIAGVINIITKKAEAKETRIGLHLEASSEGQYDISGRITSRSDQYGYTLRAGRRYFDGWTPGDSPFTEDTPIADARRDRGWNPKEQYTLGLDHTLYRPKGNWTHRLNFLQDELKDRGLPNINDASQTIVALDDVYTSYRFDNSLSYGRTFDNGIKYNGFVAHNYFLRERDQFLSDLTGVESQSVEVDSTTYHAVTTRQTFSHSYTDSLRTQFGIDGSWEKSGGERIEGDPDFWQMAGFISIEWEPLNGLLIRPGLRVGYHSIFAMPVVPSLALRYRKKEHTLRASYGRGFRAPAFKELYLAFFDSNHNVYGNPDLTPERSHNVGFSHSFSQHSSRLHWSSEVSLFYNNIEDLISLVQDGLGNEGVAPFTYFNLDKVTTQGGRVSMDLVLDNWKLGAGLGYTGKEQFENDTILVPMNYFEQINASIAYNLANQGLGISLNWTYNGAQDRVIVREDDLERFFQSGYSMLDLNISKSLWKERISLDVGVRNLLDVTDIEVSGGQGAHQGARDRTLLAMGRNYFIGLKYNLKLKGT